VHVQTIGLNAETKKCRHRVKGTICLLTFPFIGLVRFARLPGLKNDDSQMQTAIGEVWVILAAS
jgi:hypothetical protein